MYDAFPTAGCNGHARTAPRAARSRHEGLFELLGLLGWVVLLVGPWAIHVLAVTSDALAAEHFWVAGPAALFASLAWRALADGGEGREDGGFAGRAGVTLVFSAGWLVLQTVVALALFLYHGLGEPSRWLFALWTLGASVAAYASIARLLRSAVSRRSSHRRPA